MPFKFKLLCRYDEGQPPMFEANFWGRFAPERQEPATATGNATIRLPALPNAEGAGADEAPPVELEVKLAARMWGSHITPSTREGRVMELSASLTTEPRGGVVGDVEGGAPEPGTLYGFTIRRLSILAVFSSPPSGITGNNLRGEVPDEELEIIDELEGGGVDEEDPDMPEAVGQLAASGGGEALVNTTTQTTTETTPEKPSRSLFPSLAFDFEDTRGTMDIYADVALDAGQLAEAISSMPDGLDASARIMFKAKLLRAPGVNAKWKMTESGVSVAAAITYTSPDVEIDLRGEATTTCDENDPDAKAWDLTGSLRVPSFNLDLLAAASYRCASRELTAEVNVTEFELELSPDLALAVRDVTIRLDALIVRFPGEEGEEGNSTDGTGTRGDDDTSHDGALKPNATESVASAAESGDTEADVDWILEASGDISLEKGTEGMPELDCRAVLHVVLSNIEVGVIVLSQYKGDTFEGLV